MSEQNLSFSVAMHFVAENQATYQYQPDDSKAAVPNILIRKAAFGGVQQPQNLTVTVACVLS